MGCCLSHIDVSADANFNAGIKSQIQSLHHQQKLIFDGFCRSNIFIHFDYNQIPSDISNICFSYYEMNLLAFLPRVGEETPEYTEALLKLKLWRRWKHWDPQSNHNTFIDFELCKLFIDDTHQDIRCLSNRRMALILKQWKQYDDAEFVYTELFAANYDDKYVETLHYDYGVFLSDQQKYGAALHHFLKSLEMAIEIYPEGYYSGWNEATERYSNKIAVCYQSLNDSENTKKYFMTTIEKQKNVTTEAELHYNLALMFRDKIRDYTESEKHYQKSMLLGHRTSHGSYGYLCYLMGDHQAAIKHITKGIEYNKKNCYLHFYHGLVHRALGNDMEANQCLTKAVALVMKLEKDSMKRFSRHLDVMASAPSTDIRFCVECLKALAENLSLMELI